MRARNIKPAFWENEVLAELDYGARLLFIGLWCLADREGRLEDRPRRIQGQLFRWDQNPEIEKWLQALVDMGFITRYKVESTSYIQILNFTKHQHPHQNEAESTIPKQLATKARSTSTIGVSARAESVIGIRNRNEERGIKDIAASGQIPAKPVSTTETAKAKKDEKPPNPLWAKLIEQMNQAWFKKKRTPFYWHPRFFKHLRSMVSLYREWGVASLWDTFLASDDPWVKQTGYSFDAFALNIPKLVDNYGWKEASRKYEDAWLGPMPAEVLGVLSGIEKKGVDTGGNKD